MKKNYEENNSILNFIFEREELKRNLIQDGFFINHKLHIIDNYNILRINKRAIDFYEKNFMDTGCNTIIFYMDINEVRFLKDIVSIENGDGLYEILHYIKLYNSNKLNDFLKAPIRFMETMKRHGIDVYIQFYKLNKNDLKFHGRYWLSSLDNGFKAYMVDASLNTYPKSIILAQLMDDVNKDILKKYIDKELIPGCKNFKLIGLNDLRKLIS